MKTLTDDQRLDRIESGLARILGELVIIADDVAALKVNRLYALAAA